MGDFILVLCIVVAVVAGAAVGAAVFWVLKKLTKLPTRAHLATHVGVRLFSALLSFTGAVVGGCLLFPGRGDPSADIAGLIYLVLFVGIPAFVGGAGLGQRTRRH